jgi:hypothetical protein
VDAAIAAVTLKYDMACGGLPFTVCEFLDTAIVRQPGTVCHVLSGHKFELRVVVYRQGMELLAYPSIAKVAHEQYNPNNPSDKSSLINNITFSAKEVSKCGSEFMLPLSSRRTLELLGITQAELTELSSYCTHFVRHVINTVQDCPEEVGLNARGAQHV